MFVIATGNAFDGTTLIGPFPTAEDAAEYIELEHIGSLEDWQIVIVDAPKESKS